MSHNPHARDKEDKRKAVDIAVGAANTLITIAVAVFGVIGGFIQYLFTEGAKWNSAPVKLLMLAGLLALVSMVKGFCAISRAYKRGEGREALHHEPWSTGPLKEFLNWQAGLGLLSLLFFAWAVLLSGAMAHHKTLLTIKADEQTYEIPITEQPVILQQNGKETSLKLGDKAKIDLPPAPKGKPRSISIETGK